MVRRGVVLRHHRRRTPVGGVGRRLRWVLRWVGLWRVRSGLWRVRMVRRLLLRLPLRRSSIRSHLGLSLALALALAFAFALASALAPALSLATALALALALADAAPFTRRAWWRRARTLGRRATALARRGWQQRRAATLARRRRTVSHGRLHRLRRWHARVVHRLRGRPMWPRHVRRRWVSRWRSSCVEMRPRWRVMRARRRIVRAWRRLVWRWPAVGVRLVAGRHGWAPHQRGGDDVQIGSLG